LFDIRDQLITPHDSAPTIQRQTVSLKQSGKANQKQQVRLVRKMTSCEKSCLKKSCFKKTKVRKQDVAQKACPKNCQDARPVLLRRNLTMCLFRNMRLYPIQRCAFVYGIAKLEKE
jgi:hypothetical protein